MRKYLIVLNPDNFPSEIVKEMKLKKGDIVLITIEKIFADNETKKKLEKIGIIPL